MQHDALSLVPPHDVSLEQDVIAAMISDDSIAAELLAELRSEDFYSDQCRQAFAACERLTTNDKTPTAKAIARSVASTGEPKDSRPTAVDVARWIEACPFPDHVLANAKMVREYAQRRTLVEKTAEVRSAAFDLDRDFESVAAEFERTVEEIGEATTSTGGPKLVGPAKALLERLRRVDTDVIHSGIIPLDNETGGWRRGQLIIAAARPGVGKSAFACQVAANVAAMGEGVLFFSREMACDELAERLVCIMGGFTSATIREPHEADEPRIWNAANDLTEMPLYVDDWTETVNGIAGHVRRFRRKHNVRLVIVDYLQLLTPRDKKTPREQQVAEMSRELKMIAKRCGVTVLCLAQLNRDIEKRKSKKPLLSDLRESGAIEQDADKILMISRNLEGDDERAAKVGRTHDTTGPDTMWFDVAKNRSGKAGGTVSVVYGEGTYRVGVIDAFDSPQTTVSESNGVRITTFRAGDDNGHVPSGVLSQDNFDDGSGFL